MGDADIAQNISQREDELDEALAEIDEEMDRVFSFMNVLYARMSYAMSQMSCLQKFRQSFMAFNLFVVPVILAVGILYVTTGWETSESTLQVVLETLIMILMCLSLIVGLPLYARTLWDAYFTEDKEIFSIAQSNSEAGNGSASNLTMEGDPTLDEIEDSLSTIYLFRGLSRVRLHHTANYSRSDPGPREEEEMLRIGRKIRVHLPACSGDTVHHVFLPTVREDNWESTDNSEEFNVVVDDMPAVINNKNVKSAVQQIIDLDDNSNTSLKGMFQKEEDVLKFMLADWREDVTLEQDVEEASKGKQLEIGNAKSKRIRSKISIGNCKDSNHKHTVKAEKSFGL